jgi:hypothetical protein
MSTSYREVPKEVIEALYTKTNHNPLPNRLVTFVKKFRKAEKFINEYWENK